MPEKLSRAGCGPENFEENFIRQISRFFTPARYHLPKLAMAFSAEARFGKKN
jgi:hypothetical protein